MISGTVTLSARVSGNAASAGTIKATVRARQSIRGLITPGDIVVGDLPYYDGPYAVIPDETTQMLPTRTMAMSDNVTIAPIPNNYGRIAWNGTTLIVY